MENILDHVFSSSWIMMSLFFATLILTSIIAYGTNFFKNKIYNYMYKAIAILFPFLPLIFGFFSTVKYGFSNEIPVMNISADKLCFLDKKEKGNETSDWEEYRLHVLNAETGARLSRQFYDNISDIGLVDNNKLLLYSYWSYILVDINTNKQVRIISKEYLQSKFPQLSSGIESMQFSKSDNYNNQSLTISVTSKTAKTYYYEPFSDKLLNVELNRMPVSLSYGFNDDQIYWRNAENRQERLVSLEYSKESNKIKHLVFENKVVEEISRVAQFDFLESKFLEVFPDLKLFILVSYETTDKLNFILHAVNFDGKKLWTIKQSELNLKDRYTDNPKLNSSIRYNNNLIFNCGGFVISFEAVSGKIAWKQRV